MALQAVIVGCGNIAGGYDEGTDPAKQVMTHARAFALSGVKLKGVVDVSREQAEKFAKTWNAGTVFSDLASAGACDLVSICSPNETHFQLFRQAMALKPKAIICEKPLAMTAQEARTMVEEARKAGVLLAVNYFRRWDEALEKVRSQLGGWGKLQAGRVTYTKGVFHNASHGINLLSSWFGKVEGIRALSLQKIAGGDLIGSFNLGFQGAEVAFQYADASLYNTFEIDLHFENGRLRLPGGGALIEAYRAEKGKALPLSPEISPGTTQFAVKRMVENVVDSIHGRGQLKMPAEEALATVEICARIQAEAKS